MQEQTTPPSDTPEQKVPLEERGHLSRTQLYMVATFLSLAVLGLVGYIAWDYFQTNETTNQSTTTTTETEEDTTEEETTEETEDSTDSESVTSSDEELDTLSFEYTNDEDPLIYRKFSISILVPEGTAIVDSCPDTDTTADFNPVFVQGLDYCLKFHSGLWMFAPGYDSVELVATSSLFGEISRITLPDRSNSYYTNDVRQTGTCNALMEEVDAPCGFPTLDNEELDSNTTMLIVECLDGSESLESCDSVIESLEYSVTDSE